jgi:hypothetical protein
LIALRLTIAFLYYFIGFLWGHLLNESRIITVIATTEPEGNSDGLLVANVIPPVTAAEWSKA